MGLIVIMLVRLIEKDLKQGDHIYVRRKGLLYSHHGIYVGDGIVIHFKEILSNNGKKRLKYLI